MHHITGNYIFCYYREYSHTSTSLCNYNVPYRNCKYGDFQITMLAILDKTMYMYISALYGT